MHTEAALRHRALVCADEPDVWCIGPWRKLNAYREDLAAMSQTFC